MDCPRCGTSNLPTETNCAHCQEILQGVETAMRRRAEWDALPPHVRDAYAKDYEYSGDAYREHLAWLAKHRLRHAVYGALAFAIPLFVVTPHLWDSPAFLLDFALGAVAAVALNRLRGGLWHGVLCFGAAYVLSYALKAATVLRATNFWDGWWLLAALGVAAAFAAGGVMGILMDMTHRDRSTLK